MIYTTKEIPFSHYGAKSYRIEMNLSQQHHPLQRHIWTMESGEVDIQEWIPSFKTTTEELEKNGWEKSA